MSTVKGASLYWCMHRETAFGTCAENRAYVLKDGEKFNKDENGDYGYTDKSGNHHQGRNFSDTFFAWGACPDERQGKSSTSEIVAELIRNGASNEDILDVVPASFKELEKIERTRSLFRDSKFV